MGDIYFICPLFFIKNVFKMITEERKKYFRERYINLSEEQKEEHKKSRLEYYHNMSEYSKQKLKNTRKTYYLNAYHNVF